MRWVGFGGVSGVRSVRLPSGPSEDVPFVFLGGSWTNSVKVLYFGWQIEKVFCFVTLPGKGCSVKMMQRSVVHKQKGNSVLYMNKNKVVNKYDCTCLQKTPMGQLLPLIFTYL